MLEALKLLILALQLIVIAQGPNIPESIKKQTILMANLAIKVGNEAIAKEKSDSSGSAKPVSVASTTVNQSVFIVSPLPVPAPIPVSSFIPLSPLAQDLILNYASSAPLSFINITAQYLEYGKVVPIQISFFTLDDHKTFKLIKNELNVNSPCIGGLLFQVQFMETNKSSCSEDGKIEYSYLPKAIGIYTFEITAKNITKRIKIEVK